MLVFFLFLLGLASASRTNVVVHAHHHNLTEALAAVAARRAESSAPVELVLAPSVFRLESPLKFDQSHTPLTVRGSAGTSLSGGVVLDNWTPVVGKESWLFECTVGGVNPAVSQMWVGEVRRFTARSATMAFSHTCPDQSCTTVWTLPGQLQQFSALSDLRVTLYHSWTASIHKVASVDLAANTFNVSNDYSPIYDGNGANSGNRFYFENAPEYLAPQSATFYFNAASRLLQYAPSAAELADGSFRTQAVAANLTELVTGNGETNVTYVDITFEHSAVEYAGCYSGYCDGQSADFLQTAALHWANSQNIILRNVTVRHTGGYAVWFGDGVTGAALQQSHVYDLGAGAVRIGHGQSGLDAAAARNVTVADCVLEDGGHVYREGCGVLMQTAHSCTVTHNNVHQFSYTGISAGWTWNYIPTSEGSNEISYNLIYNIGLGDLSDMGCVYHLGYDPGTVINNNVCHNVSTFSYGGWAYYTDQASRGVQVTNNIAYDTKCGGFHQHYGEDNVVQNNIFALVNNEDCDAAIRSSAHDSPGDEGDRSSFAFLRNIVYVQDGLLFFASSNNSFANETFDNNVYFSVAGGETFPCIDESLQVGQYIASPSGNCFFTQNADGSACVVPGTVKNPSPPVWCTNASSGPEQAYVVMMQGDGNLCVYNPGQPALWCDMVSAKGPQQPYFATLGDDYRLCVHTGTYPVVAETLWCSPAKPSVEALKTPPLGFPTSCTKAAWQAAGQDLHSIVADPQFTNVDARDFSLKSGSPALSLGFVPIDISTVGPRN